LLGIHPEEGLGEKGEIGGVHLLSRIVAGGGEGESLEVLLGEAGEGEDSLPKGGRRIGYHSLSYHELGKVGEAGEQMGDLTKQGEAILLDLLFLDHDHDLIEEAIHGGAESGDLLQGSEEVLFRQERG
jgi:hypothetical protein